MFEYCLFDLDGTLTDPAEGITKSVQYALRRFGYRGIESEKAGDLYRPTFKGQLYGVLWLYAGTGAGAKSGILIRAVSEMEKGSWNG